MNLRNIKLEAPAFDGQLDPQFSLDWTSNMDHVFDWYNMSNARRIRFAKMKLVRQARQYWANAEKLMTLRRYEPVQSCDEMKLKL